MKIESKQIANRDYECAICGGIIKKGEQYSRRPVIVSDNESEFGCELQQLPCHIECYDGTITRLFIMDNRLKIALLEKEEDLKKIQKAEFYNLPIRQQNLEFWCSNEIKKYKYFLGLVNNLSFCDSAKLDNDILEKMEIIEGK